MNDINTIAVVGRVTHDINDNNFGYTNGGTARLNISVAVNESRKNGGTWEDYANFFDVTIWGKTAENLRPYIGKGKQLAIVGRLHQDRWTSNDGAKHSRVLIVADNVELIGGNNSAGNQQQAQNKAPAMYYEEPTGTGEDFPEDIPF